MQKCALKMCALDLHFLIRRGGRHGCRLAPADFHVRWHQLLRARSAPRAHIILLCIRSPHCILYSDSIMHNIHYLAMHPQCTAYYTHDASCGILSSDPIMRTYNSFNAVEGCDIYGMMWFCACAEYIHLSWLTYSLHNFFFNLFTPLPCWTRLSLSGLRG